MLFSHSHFPPSKTFLQNPPSHHRSIPQDAFQHDNAPPILIKITKIYPSPETANGLCKNNKI